MKFITICCICLALVFVALWSWKDSWQNPLRVPVQAYTELTQVTSAVTSNTVTFPRAVVLSLVLAAPKGATSPFREGDVGISIWQGNKEVFSKSYDSESAQQSNWLDQKGLVGFFLDNLEDHSPEIRSACLKGENLFSISISNAAIGSTVWLKYRQLSGWKLKDR